MQLIDYLREHAYWSLATEQSITVLQSEHGAKVAGHLVDAIDQRIAQELPTHIIMREYYERIEGADCE